MARRSRSTGRNVTIGGVGLTPVAQIRAPPVRHALRYVLLRMRNRSRCRGGTCIELAITIGAIGALIIVLTSMVARKLERTGVVAADSGAMCR